MLSLLRTVEVEHVMGFSLLLRDCNLLVLANEKIEAMS
jgi:hypothetical protein